MAVEDLLAHLSSDPRVCLRNQRAIPELPPVDRRASTACVLYWMQRAQRATDNPALDVAVAAANALQVPLHVLFRVVDDFPGANLRS